MEDLRSILSSHRLKSKTDSAAEEVISSSSASLSEIPDLFFDEILIRHKLSRQEILLLMYLYRVTWCRPNLHKKYGIAPMVSHQELAALFDINLESLYLNFRSLESFGFIETIRSGQYFVRKYFTEDNDKKYGQTYDNFL